MLDTNDAKEHDKIALGFVYDMKHKIAEKVIDSLLCVSFITSLSTSTSAPYIHTPVFLKFSIIGILLWAGHICVMYDGMRHC